MKDLELANELCNGCGTVGCDTVFANVPFHTACIERKDMKLTDGNPTMPVKIGRRYYLLKDGDLHSLPKRDAVVRIVIIAAFLAVLVLLIAITLMERTRM